MPEVLELVEQHEVRLQLRSWHSEMSALIATLSTETGLLKGRLGQPLDRSQSSGAQHDGLLVINSSPTELARKAVAQNDIDELDRTLEDQGERRWADERRTLNAENEIEGELVRGDDHGENRLQVSTNEEDCSTLAEEYEDIQDDVTFADGAWNKKRSCVRAEIPVRQRVGPGRQRRSVRQRGGEGS